MIHVAAVTPTILVFEIELTAKGSYLQGFASTRNSLYFKRELEGVGRKKIEVYLPIAPKKLYVEAVGANIKSFDQKPLKTVWPTDAKMTAYCLFIFEFAKIAGLLDAGHYAKGGFLINCLPQIIDEDGIVDTPARIRVADGYIEVNLPQMQSLTVPQRIMILLHEYMHYHFQDAEDEEMCDREAAKVFVKLGFPKTEGAFAFTEVLNDSHYDRAESIINFIRYL